MVWFNRLSGMVFGAITVVIVLLTICMSLVVFGQIVLRYIVDQPFSWTEELARVTFLLWTLLGAIIAYREDRHMGLDVVEMRLAKNPRNYLILFRNLLVLIFCAVMFWQGIVLVANLRASTPILRLPFSAIYLILPFMMICLFFLCLRKIVGDIKRIHASMSNTNPGFSTTNRTREQ